jgi:hypothetical protein
MSPLPAKSGPTVRPGSVARTNSSTTNRISASPGISGTSTGVQRTAPAESSLNAATTLGNPSQAGESSSNAAPAPAALANKVEIKGLIQKLGANVKASLGSDLTAGILALLALIVALLMGAWSIYLAEKSLDIGKWTFCKTFPTDNVSFP